MEPERIEAARAGLEVFAGKPCVQCGSTERYVVTSRCAPCARKKMRDRAAKHRAYIKALRAEGGND